MINFERDPSANRSVGEVFKALWTHACNIWDKFTEAFSQFGESISRALSSRSVKVILPNENDGLNASSDAVKSLEGRGTSSVISNASADVMVQSAVNRKSGISPEAVIAESDRLAKEAGLLKNSENQGNPGSRIEVVLDEEEHSEEEPVLHINNQSSSKSESTNGKTIEKNEEVKPEVKAEVKEKERADEDLSKDLNGKLNEEGILASDSQEEMERQSLENARSEKAGFNAELEKAIRLEEELQQQALEQARSEQELQAKEMKELEKARLDEDARLGKLLEKVLDHELSQSKKVTSQLDAKLDVLEKELNTVESQIEQDMMQREALEQARSEEEGLNAELEKAARSQEELQQQAQEQAHFEQKAQALEMKKLEEARSEKTPVAKAEEKVSDSDHRAAIQKAILAGNFVRERPTIHKAPTIEQTGNMVKGALNQKNAIAQRGERAKAGEAFKKTLSANNEALSLVSDSEVFSIGIKFGDKVSNLKLVGWDNLKVQARMEEFNGWDPKKQMEFLKLLAREMGKLETAQGKQQLLGSASSDLACDSDIVVALNGMKRLSGFNAFMGAAEADEILYKNVDSLQIFVDVLNAMNADAKAEILKTIQILMGEVKKEKSLKPVNIENSILVLDNSEKGEPIGIVVRHGDVVGSLKLEGYDNQRIKEKMEGFNDLDLEKRKELLQSFVVDLEPSKFGDAGKKLLELDPAKINISIAIGTEAIAKLKEQVEVAISTENAHIAESVEKMKPSVNGLIQLLEKEEKFQEWLGKNEYFKNLSSQLKKEDVPHNEFINHIRDLIELANKAYEKGKIEEYRDAGILINKLEEIEENLTMVPNPIKELRGKALQLLSLATENEKLKNSLGATWDYALGGRFGTSKQNDALNTFKKELTHDLPQDKLLQEDLIVKTTQAIRTIKHGIEKGKLEAPEMTQLINEISNLLIEHLVAKQEK